MVYNGDHTIMSMLGDLYNSNMFLALQGQLNASQMRQKVISHNIANVDTPNFKRSEVAFESVFKQAMIQAPLKLKGHASAARHIPINPTPEANRVAPSIWRQNDSFARADNNNVDIDVEMADLAKTQMMYEASINRLTGIFKGLTNVIRNTD